MENVAPSGSFDLPAAQSIQAVQITKAQESDWSAIQELQHANCLAEEERDSEKGFLHIKMNAEKIKALIKEPGIILARKAGKVVGYLISMSKEQMLNENLFLPVLSSIHMMQMKGELPNNYLFIAQTCVDKDHRQKGIMKEMIEALSKAKPRAKILTEIDEKNICSQEAFEKIGFEKLTRLTPDTDCPVENWFLLYGLKK